MVLHQQQQNWSFNEKTFRSIFENINQLRKNKTLCDVILKVDNEQFYAHRIILSACSDYFCAMFTSEVMQPLNFAFRSVLSVVY
jgi:hypothetical protein